jgi:hypothetical protein
MFNISVLRPVAVVLAVCLVAFGASSAFSADQFRYVGYTSDYTSTGAQGYFAPHRACADDFGDEAVWCTIQMVIEGGPATDATDPDFTGAWINPTPTGATGTNMVDFSGRIISPLNSNCAHWFSGTASYTGMILRGQGGGYVDFVNADCSVPRPVACCALEGGGRPQR